MCVWVWCVHRFVSDCWWKCSSCVFVTCHPSSCVACILQVQISRGEHPSFKHGVSRIMSYPIGPAFQQRLARIAHLQYAVQHTLQHQQQAHHHQQQQQQQQQHQTMHPPSQQQQSVRSTGMPNSALRKSVTSSNTSDGSKISAAHTGNTQATVMTASILCRIVDSSELGQFSVAALCNVACRCAHRLRVYLVGD